MPITHGQGNPDWSRDETILALDLVLRAWPKIPGSQSAEVKALSALIRRLPVHAGADKNDRFRNPDGVYLKLQNLVSLHPSKQDRKGLRTSHMDREVWKQYWSRPALVSQLAAQIAKGIEEIEAAPLEDLAADDGFEGQEGAVLARVHRFRERKRGFRSRLLKEVERRHGSLRCESCGQAAPGAGDLGQAVFEVHHLVPLARVATTTTKLADLALLCANCHRLIHAMMKQKGAHCTVEDLRSWRNSRVA